MQIRGATPEDVEWLVGAAAAMARETEGRTLDEDRVRRGVAEAVGGHGRYFIADDQGPIGSLFVTREWSDWNATWYWWIQGVYVDPARRGQGVYRALHEAVMAAAQADGVAEVRLYVDAENTVAQATYEALGMHASDYRIYEARPDANGRFNPTPL